MADLPSQPGAVLFDVDGTLAVRSSAHLTALVTVAARVLGAEVAVAVHDERPHIGRQDVTGWIDAQVWRLLLDQVGRTDESAALLPVLVADYGDEYRRMLETGDACAGTPVPGAGSTLDRLAARGIPVGLVTGNAAVIAQLKLERLGLARPFTFAPEGGFGDWRRGRWDLPAAAAALLGVLPGPDVWLVGDTVADMAGARGAGLTAVGVLTGADDTAALRAAGAQVILPSVADLP